MDHARIIIIYMQDFDIIEGLDNMQMDAIMALLMKITHWTAHCSEQKERLAMEHSFCNRARCR